MRYVKGLGNVKQRFGITNKEMIANAISEKNGTPVKELMKKNITELREIWRKIS